MLQSLTTVATFVAIIDGETQPVIQRTPCGRTRAEVLNMYRRGVFTRRQCNSMLAKIA